MTNEELERQARRDITSPFQTTLDEAYIMGARFQESEDNEFLESIKSDLTDAVKEQDWDAVECIIEDINRALKP